MYMICFYDLKNGKQLWEIIDGEDAMQCRVGELCDEYGLDSDDDIMVFDMDNEIV